MMQISIVIPVYNAATFVTRAVESALLQPETAEILLVEDNSPDNSLEVCQALAKRYNKVKLLRHPGGMNRGPGASRNLGMKNASYDYIGFVDADNFYLPDRFSKTIEVFETNPDCEGVYGCIANFVQNETGLRRWENSNRQADKIKRVIFPVPPEQLGVVLIKGASGGIALDALVLKRSVLIKTGLMNEDLFLHQDTEFIVRVALAAKLYPSGSDNPVALRGVHDHNRISAPRSKAEEYQNKMRYWTSLYQWSKVNCDISIQKVILTAIMDFSKNHKILTNSKLSYLPKLMLWPVRLSRLLEYPEIVKDLINFKFHELIIKR